MNIVSQQQTVTQHQRTTTQVNKLPKYAVLASDDIFGTLYCVQPESEIEAARSEGWRVFSKGHGIMRAWEIREDLYNNTNPFEVY